ncbi:MAG: class I SAM-dependent methyltransferase [Akkermansiaceae bacterium]
MHSKALKFHLETLESPLPAGDTLLLNAEPAPYLDHLTDHNITVITQLANTHNLWKEKHTETHHSTDQKFDLIIHYATKFATENIATIGTYIQNLKPNGTWISIIPNRTGASRLKRDITKAFTNVETTSKAKCRIFQCSPEKNDHDQKLTSKWSTLNTPAPIKGTNLLTLPGVFSADKIDTGSLLLAEILQQETWYGSVADLGAAYGYLSHIILGTTRQKMKNLCLYELDHRALTCAKINLTKSNTNEKTNIEYHWTDVTQTIPHQRPFDTVIMNPPFHEAQDASFTLGKTFIQQAANILKPGGTLYLVANLHLPYEQTLIEHFRSHRLLKEAQGFKIFLARK